ncbi:CmpA/NrtA family ABC transporter substrate-binding protein [Emcibacter sp. SYSU 3D8]|uniref:CmpA/NrtA family ABC transporter substrate-binding protein n=1 Tax=Emcibacter sp. SYSU 3D8 TaxID=3133969 RepID=UPI0031FE8666
MKETDNSIWDAVAPMEQAEPERQLRTVRIGFIPLVDCATLVVAAEKGFDRREGLALQLVKETSWANIRDRVNLGHFDCAHMLAGMPIASSMGIGHIKVPTIAPFLLGLNGNAVTVSLPLYQQIRGTGVQGDDPASLGRALRQVVDERRRAGLEPLTFAMVFPFSCHNYELRYWMAAAGIDPDRDIRLVVIPPPLMVDSLEAGHIDGFCVGEPWNSLAVDAGIGRLLLTKAALWNMGVEKVLGVRADWADDNRPVLESLIRALYRAAQWADDPANRDELADMLAQPAYLGVSSKIIRRSLSGDILVQAGQPPVHVDDFIVFNRQAANFPWVSQAVWIYTQMVRWGQAEASSESETAARRCFRPDIYRTALRNSDLAVSLPSMNAKLEGALAGEIPVGSVDGKLTLGPDRFFDGGVFDPDDPEGYLHRFAIRT